jgi:hypothetical protein
MAAFHKRLVTLMPLNLTALRLLLLLLLTVTVAAAGTSCCGSCCCDALLALCD